MWSPLILLLLAAEAAAFFCHNPVFVRWPRVKLNFRAVATGRLSLRACESACALGEDPVENGKTLECAALNHHQSADQYNHHCDVFQPHQLQNVDGFVEADDRFSFYWKYCVNSARKCGGDYAFTYISDRYMDAGEVIQVRHTSSLEDCLAECMNEANFPCRSLSFNRTDGGCHLSANNQLTKPNAIKLNNNPNFRIDYYENNCYNLSESFKFSYECKDDGVLVKIDSKFPYTGALYGLYDFFTCRIEPKEQTNFQYFFPSPMESKNCSDSIRYKGNDMVLEVVLSTDGVEPLYFITPDDMTFQARCPIKNKISSPKLTVPVLPEASGANDIDADQFAASAHALFSLLSQSEKEKVTVKDEEKQKTKGTTVKQIETKVTKDTFKLPLTTPSRTLSTTTTRTTTLSTTRKTTTTKAPTTTKKTTTSKPTTTTTHKTTTRAPTSSTSTTTRTTTTTTTATTTQKTTTKQPITTTATQKPKEVVHVVHQVDVQQSPPTLRPPPPPTPNPSTPHLARAPTVATTVIGPPGTNGDKVKTPVTFDVFHNGRPVEAVVVGSRITLDFTPHFPIPPRYMSVRGCQVEPIDSKYDWEKDPLPIIKDGCPADFVGLACPPRPTDHGMKVSIEAFRYQTTAHVQYTCLIRVCPFAECPESKCPSVEGCEPLSVLGRVRRSSSLTLEDIRKALEADPSLQAQIGLPNLVGVKPSVDGEQQLLALAGDHVVKRRLVVVNSEDQLRYYVRTGDVP